MKQGRTYVKNGIGPTVELEVGGPDSFTVRIQRLEDLPRYNPLLGGLAVRAPRKEVNVSILLGLGTGSKRSAVRFVADLLATLPKEPWKGLGLVESFTAKSLWKRWAAGLEDR